MKRIKNSGIMNLEELISQDEKGRVRGLREKLLAISYELFRY